MALINLSNYGYKPNFHRLVYEKIINRYPRLAKWTLAEFYEEGFYFNLIFKSNRVNIEIRNSNDGSFVREFRPLFKFDSTSDDLLIGGFDFWLRWFGLPKGRTGNTRDDKVNLFEYLREAYSSISWIAIENMSNYNQIRLRSRTQVTDTFNALYNFIPIADKHETQLVFDSHYYKNMQTFRDLVELLATSQRGISEKTYFANTVNLIG